MLDIIGVTHSSNSQSQGSLVEFYVSKSRLKNYFDQMTSADLIYQNGLTNENKIDHPRTSCVLYTSSPIHKAEVVKFMRHHFAN